MRCLDVFGGPDDLRVRPSTAVGPPGIGTYQTCIIGGVTRWTDPEAHSPAVVRPTTVPKLPKQRLVWMCHGVRQPPGCGGFDGAGPRQIHRRRQHGTLRGVRVDQ